MADFDTIYEENDDEGPPIDNYDIRVPDPITIRGAGNVTMYVLCHFGHFRLSLCHVWGICKYDKCVFCIRLCSRVV